LAFGLTLRADVPAAPMTTAGREAPFRIPVTHGGRKGLILLDQIRAVDKSRLAKKLGSVPAKTLTAALMTLKEVFR
jgi:mRNA interferase MazF